MIASKFFEAFNILSPRDILIQEAQQVINRMIVAGSEPSDKYQSAIGAWISKMVSDGDWAISDAMWVFEAEDETQSLVNWKDGTYDATKVSTPVFAKNVGWRSDGVAGYINSQFAPGDGVNFLQDDNSFHMYCPTSGVAATDDYAYGTREDTSDERYFLRIRTISNTQRVWSNNLASGSEILTTQTITDGLFSNVRTSSTVAALQLDGVEIDTDGATSDTPPTNKFFLCAINDQSTAGGFMSNKDIGYIVAGSKVVSAANLGVGHTQYLIDIA